MNLSHPPSPRAIALDNLGQPVDGGAKRTRAGWLNWGKRQLTATDKRLGFHCVVGYYNDEYYRVHFAAQPASGLRVTRAGRIVS